MASNEIKVSVDDESVARAVAILRAAGRQLAETIGKLEGYAFEGYAVEPWTVETPQGTLCGYVDDANQEHWVAVGKFIPAAYRKLYVEKRA